MTRRHSRLIDALEAGFRSFPDRERVWPWIKRLVRRITPKGQRGMPPSAVQLEQQTAADFFFFGVIDWHFRFQRPQHLALELAKKGHRVFYLSPEFIDDRKPGFRVERLREGVPIYQVLLHVWGAPVIYGGPPSASAKDRLRQSLNRLRDWTGSREGVCLLQHPFWFRVTFEGPEFSLLYDCLDHHEGFNTFGAEMVEAEHRLMAASDLVVVSSSWLDKAVAPYNQHRVVLRNAADFLHFSQPPPTVYKDSQKRKIIGYYGAIASWFDLNLMIAVARQFPAELVLLIGRDQCGAASRLSGLSNVILLGEVSYQELPHYLYAFDVCLLPFVVSDLTLATNPVKVYEYLSAGKEVVSVDLPEMRQFGSLVRLASGEREFVEAVGLALREPGGPEVAARRRSLVATQTWHDRAESLITAIQEAQSRKQTALAVGG